MINLMFLKNKIYKSVAIITHDKGDSNCDFHTMLLSYKTLGTRFVGMIIWRIKNRGKRSLEKM